MAAVLVASIQMQEADSGDGILFAVVGLVASAWLADARVRTSALTISSESAIRSSCARSASVRTVGGKATARHTHDDLTRDVFTFTGSFISTRTLRVHLVNRPLPHVERPLSAACKFRSPQLGRTSQLEYHVHKPVLALSIFTRDRNRLCAQSDFALARPRQRMPAKASGHTNKRRTRG